MTPEAFDHVGIVVDDFDAVPVVAAQLGLELRSPEPEPELGIEILWAHSGAVALEFIRPLRADARAAEVLRHGRGGVHHVAFAVEDIDRTLAALAAAGIATRPGDPRPGSRGSRIAFLDGSSAGGWLVELVEHRGAPGGRDAAGPQ